MTLSIVVLNIALLMVNMQNVISSLVVYDQLSDYSLYTSSLPVSSPG